MSTGKLKAQYNRVRTSTALHTTSIWENTIGLQQDQAGTNSAIEASIYAPGGGGKGRDAKRQRAQELIEATGFQPSVRDFEGLKALARRSGGDAAALNRGACKMCGGLGHLTKQCKNFLDKGSAAQGAGAAAAAGGGADAAGGGGMQLLTQEDEDALLLQSDSMDSSDLGSGSGSDSDRERKRRRKERSSRDKERSSSKKHKKEKGKKSKKSKSSSKHKRDRRSSRSRSRSREDRSDRRRERSRSR